MGCGGSKNLFTNEIRAENILDEEDQGALLRNKNLIQEQITFNLKINKVHMRSLSVKDQCFVKFSFCKFLFSFIFIVAEHSEIYS